jgi:hypothetical protein
MIDPICIRRSHLSSLNASDLLFHTTVLVDDVLDLLNSHSVRMAKEAVSCNSNGYRLNGGTACN